MFTSKKFWASVLGTALSITGIATGLPVEQVLTLIAPLFGYTVGQGIADTGKEAAKIHRG